MTNCGRDQLGESDRTRWWKVRKMITRRWLSRSGPLLDLIRGVTEFDKNLLSQIKVKVEQMRDEAMTPPNLAVAPARQKALWDAAVDFFLDQSQLVERIVKDEGMRGLKPNVSQEQALTVMLHSLLDARRRELCGRTEYEERIWRKLWPISKSLMQEFQEGHGRPRPAGYRCSQEHASEIRLRILRDMPNDPAVRSIKTYTIKGYFDQFCDECLKLASQEYAWVHYGEDDVGTGLPSYLKILMLNSMKRCIDQLSERERGVVLASLEEDEGAKYRCREGMEMDEFRRLRNLALRHLRIFLDPKEQR
jgi:Holliday junction resolvase-like predicted endonuclease